MSLCRSCYAPVRWVQTEAGKAMPLDPEPRDDGNIEMTGRKAQTLAGTMVPVVRYTTGHQLALGSMDAADRFVSHFSTCPEADEWRRRS